jgi:hypothetical protein
MAHSECIPTRLNPLAERACSPFPPGTPFVARCDLMWPEHAAEGAKNNTQYIFLKDTLVAPIWEMKTNSTSRMVWVPP